jgi:hypothetical protein
MPRLRSSWMRPASGRVRDMIDEVVLRSRSGAVLKAAAAKEQASSQFLEVTDRKEGREHDWRQNGRLPHTPLLPSRCLLLCVRLGHALHAVLSFSDWGLRARDTIHRSGKLCDDILDPVFLQSPAIRCVMDLLAPAVIAISLSIAPAPGSHRRARRFSG